MARGESPQVTDVPQTTWLYYVDQRWKQTREKEKVMNKNSFNHMMEHQNRHQDMLRKAEQERRINSILRSRKTGNNLISSLIAQLKRWAASQLGDKPVVERERVYASPSQKK